MHHIDWTRGPNSALDDLKELPPHIAQALMAVAEQEITINLRADDPDEGAGPPPLFWRRGITRAQRVELREQEASTPASQDVDGIDQPWNYILVYRGRTEREVIDRRRGPGMVILRVISNGHLAYELPRVAAALTGGQSQSVV